MTKCLGGPKELAPSPSLGHLPLYWVPPLSQEVMLLHILFWFLCLIFLETPLITLSQEVLLLPKTLLSFLILHFSRFSENVAERHIPKCENIRSNKKRWQLLFSPPGREASLPTRKKKIYSIFKTLSGFPLPQIWDFFVEILIGWEEGCCWKYSVHEGYCWLLNPTKGPRHLSSLCSIITSLTWTKRRNVTFPIRTSWLFN